MRQTIATPEQAQDAPPLTAAVAVVSQYGTVAALRTDTGAMLWQHVTGEQPAALLHDGATIYAASHFRGAEQPPESGPRPSDSHELEEWARARKLRASYHATLAALRASDGAVRWRREGWLAPNYHRGPHAVLMGDLIITDLLGPEIGQHQITALDRATGTTRWTYTIGGASGSLLGAGSGHVFIRVGRLGAPSPHIPLHADADSESFRALDAQTGAVVWQSAPSATYALTSPGSTYIVVGRPATADGEPVYAILSAADGTIVTEIPRDYRLQAISDAGIAYATLRHAPHRSPILAALHIPDWTELWRKTALDTGSFEPYYVTLSGEWLLHWEYTRPHDNADITALDPLTGRPLWRWRSPRNIFALLRVWGRNTPAMLGRALAEVRRMFQDARTQVRRKRFIAWPAFWWELRNGSLRYPGHLIGSPTIVFSGEHAYVATSMGLYALRASDGRYLWNALPARDLSRVAPAASRQPALASGISADQLVRPR